MSVGLESELDCSSSFPYPTPSSSAPSSPSAIAFAPALTTVNFNDPPPQLVSRPATPVSPTLAPTLFPAFISEDPASPCSPTTPISKRKPDSHVPRPPNAFILFRSSFIKQQHVSTDVETSHSTLSKIIGLTWKSLPPHERSEWHAKAKRALDEHKAKFPQYAFKPNGSSSSRPKPSDSRPKATAGKKRKVREVGPADEVRCAEIASLLAQGLKGAELDAAMRDFDAKHVPEIVTRFEDPILPTAYERPRKQAKKQHSADDFVAAPAKKQKVEHPPVQTRKPSLVQLLPEIRPRYRRSSSVPIPTPSDAPFLLQPFSPLSSEYDAPMRIARASSARVPSPTFTEIDDGSSLGQSSFYSLAGANEYDGEFNFQPQPQPQSQSFSFSLPPTHASVPSAEPYNYISPSIAPPVQQPQTRQPRLSITTLLQSFAQPSPDSAAWSAATFPPTPSSAYPPPPSPEYVDSPPANQFSFDESSFGNCPGSAPEFDQHYYSSTSPVPPQGPVFNSKDEMQTFRMFQEIAARGFVAAAASHQHQEPPHDADFLSSYFADLPLEGSAF